VLPVLVACSLVGLSTVPQRLKPHIFCDLLRRASKARPFKTKPDHQARPRSPFPLLHHLRELLEQIVRIMRPRRGLRVILHAEQRQVPVAQAFERLVVQVDVGQLDFAVRDRRRSYGCAP
jgi:hypothetical protein